MTKREIGEAFLRLAESVPERFRVIDASGEEEFVFARVEAVVTEVLDGG